MRLKIEINTRDKVIYCYNVHKKNAVDKLPTRKQLLANLTEKMPDRKFTEDIRLVIKQGVEYDNEAARELVRQKLVEKIQVLDDSNTQLVNIILSYHKKRGKIVFIAGMYNHFSFICTTFGRYFFCNARTGISYLTRISFTCNS